MYVIVQRDQDNLRVWGPYYSKYGANHDVVQLEEISPDFCYEVHRINLPKNSPKSRT